MLVFAIRAERNIIIIVILNTVGILAFKAIYVLWLVWVGDGLPAVNCTS